MEVYAKLKGVVFLAIANFIMFPGKKEWKSEHHILDKETYENDLKDLKFVFVELPKFQKNLDQLVNIQEKWIYFLKSAHESSIKEMGELIGNDASIKRAFEAIDQASWSEAELNTYEQYIKHQIDNAAVDGLKIYEAKVEGIEIGERKKAIETARNLLQLGTLPLEQIAAVTSLSISEVEQIASELKND